MKFFVSDKEVTIKEYCKEFNKGFYDENENEEKMCLTFNKEKQKKALRRQREPFLLAFDKWEKAVLRGREVDDPTVMLWYQDLKELKESAFENIPERIRYYLGGAKG